MSDYYNAVVVVLESDIKDERAEPTLNALRMVKGVLSVHPQVADSGDLVAEDRARHDMKMKVFDFAREL